MHTILIADDSQTIQRAVEIVFDKEPFTVVKAGSGGEALARARDSRPHLVLVDHLMPDQTGYEVAEALRADPSTAQIPILILSTNAVPYDEGRARAAGVLGHVPKPFDCTTLLDRVKTILGVTATGPVAGAAVAAAPPAAVAATPRPPAGVPGFGRPTLSQGVPPAGLPRPPTFGGASAAPMANAAPAGMAAFGAAPTAPRPMQTSSIPAAATPAQTAPAHMAPTHATPTHVAPTQTAPMFAAQSFPTPTLPVQGGVSPFASQPGMGQHAVAQPAMAAQVPPRTQTPMPTRDLDPFGFGATLPQPAAPAAAARPFNPFAAATAPVATPSTVPFAAPPQTNPPRAPEADFEVSLEDIVPPVAPSNPSLSEAEFMEVMESDFNSTPPSSLPPASVPPTAALHAAAPAVATPAVSTPALTPLAAALAEFSQPTFTPAPSVPAISDPDARATARVNTGRLAELDRQAELTAGATARVVQAAAPLVAALEARSTAAAPAAAPAAAAPTAAAAAATSEAALSAEARAIVERIAWEVVPELAEAIIREEIRRLLQSK